MPRHGIASAVEASRNAKLPAKQARISGRIRQAIALLLSGECATQKAAAARAGINPEHLCRMLKTPQVGALIARETRSTLSQAQAPAAATLVRLLGADSENVQAHVAEKLLAINGIAADQTTRVAVSVDVRAGYVIDLSGNNSPKQVIDQTDSHNT